MGWTGRMGARGSGGMDYCDGGLRWWSLGARGMGDGSLLTFQPN